MASETTVARERSVSAANAMSEGRRSPFANEKRMQAQFGLRNRPDRFVNKKNARSFAAGAVKFNRIMHIADNDYGLKHGWYVMTPADAERMYKKTNGKFTYTR